MFTSSSPSSSSLSGAVLNSRSRFGGTTLKGGASLGIAKRGASAAAWLLSSLPMSSESLLLCRGDYCKMASMSRPLFFGSADEDACFRFAFSKAFAFSGPPWPSASFNSAAR